MARGNYISAGISPDTTFEVVSAISLERRKVRVTFSDAPKAVFAGGYDDALNPSNWTITPRPDLAASGVNPSYTTLVVKKILVVSGDSLSVDVCFDDDFSFEYPYQITASPNIVQLENIGGWTPETEGNKLAIFLPFDPGCRQKPVADVFSWFGRAARKYDYTQDMERFVSLLQDLLEQMKFLMDCFPEQFDPLYCREDFLDSRMRSLGNPFELVTSEMSLVEKRRVALQLISIYRLKGTIPGIQSALEKILGVAGVSVLSWNENTARIEETHLQLEIPFDGVLPNGTVNTPFLGGGLFVPVGGPPGYPTDPIDPTRPENFQYTGTTFLGGAPEYPQAYLAGDDPLDDTKHVAHFGQWNLAGDNHIPYLLNPADMYVVYPNVQSDDGFGVVKEKDRFGLYAYRIVLPTGFSPSALELQRILTIAKYMQPSNMHLVQVQGSDGTVYDPVEMGVSWLGVDWILHG